MPKQPLLRRLKHLSGLLPRQHKANLKQPLVLRRLPLPLLRLLLRLLRLLLLLLRPRLRSHLQLRSLNK